MRGRGAIDMINLQEFIFENTSTIHEASTHFTFNLDALKGLLRKAIIEDRKAALKVPIHPDSIVGSGASGSAGNPNTEKGSIT